MASKQSDKSSREGMTVVELMEMFPTEEAAVAWFEECLWPVERHCGKCGSLRTREVPNAKPMPYWCTDCRSYFSVRTGTADGAVECPDAEVGHRHLSLPDLAQVGFEQEAGAGHRCQQEHGVVHDDAYSRSLGRG